VFFFEKKNQKTLAVWHTRPVCSSFLSAVRLNMIFLLLFFKKEAAFSFCL